MATLKMQAYPKYTSLPFFVFGESYAGHYVPSLSAYILNNNPSAAIKINLRGSAVGNGLVDPQIQVLSFFKAFSNQAMLIFVESSTAIMQRMRRSIILCGQPSLPL